jgi:spermidine/putrescine transport system substrate-binding protein
MNSIHDLRRLERLKDRYLNGDIDRRGFLGLIGTAGIAAGFVGGPFQAFAQSADVKQLRFDNWGGVVSEAMRKTGVAAYEKATSVKVIEGTFGLEEEILAKAKAGRPGDYNVISSAGVAWYKRWIDSGFGVVLNESAIPNLKTVIPALLAQFRKVTPNGLSAVPFCYGNTGIAFNTKFISVDRAKAEREKLLVAPEFKGKISGHNDFQTRMWVASLQTGQNPNDIKDLDAVWSKIRENRSLIKKYWGSGAESMELLASGEVYVSDIWSGRAAALMARDPNIGYVDYSTGYSWAQDLLVLKGSPVALCEQFLNFLLDPAVAVAVAEAQLYPPSADPSKVALTEKIKSLPNYDPTGTFAKFDYAEPDYWTRYEKTWKPMYSRIEKGF